MNTIRDSIVTTESDSLIYTQMYGKTVIYISTIVIARTLLCGNLVIQY